MAISPTAAPVSPTAAAAVSIPVVAAPVSATEASAVVAAAASTIAPAAAAPEAPEANTNLVALRAYFAAETNETALAALAGLDVDTRAELLTDLYARLGGQPVEGHDVAVDHVAATPKSEHVQAAAQAILNKLAPVVAEAPAPVDAPKGFFASVCERISSFFSSLYTGIVDFFSCLFAAAPVAQTVQAPATVLSSVKEFQASVNVEGGDVEVLKAAYAALCAQFPEAKDKIEHKIYEAAVAANEFNGSDTFGTDHVAANPASALVKAALVAYVAELETPAAPAEAPVATATAA